MASRVEIPGKIAIFTLLRQAWIEVHVVCIHHHESARRIHIANNNAVVHAVLAEGHYTKFLQVALGTYPACVVSEQALQ